MSGNAEKKKKAKVKRRKTLDKTPRVTVLRYEEADQEVECRLELSNRNTITFKFAIENDEPEEIVDNLVRAGFCSFGVVCLSFYFCFLFLKFFFFHFFVFM